MTRKALVTEIVAVAGTAFLASLLLWLSLYLGGILMLLPAVVVLIFTLALLQHKMRNLQSLAEYAVFAWLLATQASVVVAILIRVLPSLGRHIGGIV